MEEMEDCVIVIIGDDLCGIYVRFLFNVKIRRILASMIF